MGMPAPVRNGFRSRLVVVVALVAYGAPALYAQVDGDAQRAKTNIRKRLVGAASPEGMGETALERGDYENAIRFFSIALEKSAPESRTFYGRGAANYLLRRYPEAIADCSQAVRLDPRCVDALRVPRGGVPRTQADGNGAFRRE